MILYFDIVIKLNKKHQKILDSIFVNPVRSNVIWNDIEKLLKALGTEISEGRGSRVRFYLNGVRAFFTDLILRKKLIKVL